MVPYYVNNCVNTHLSTQYGVILGQNLREICVSLTQRPCTRKESAYTILGDFQIAFKKFCLDKDNYKKIILFNTLVTKR